MRNSSAQVEISKNRRRSVSVRRWCVVLTLFVVSAPAFVYHFFPKLSTASSTAPLARLSSHASIKVSHVNNRTVNLSDGHDLLTSYVGPQELTNALEQNLVETLSLATADFDEDGVPDLVSGYAYNGRGIVTLARGNVDSIYPNAPEAKQRRANGTFTNAPFLSPARVFDAPIAAEFIGAGDFNADGHWDLVVASRSHPGLFYLAGDGQGQLGLWGQVPLPGVVTTMLAGEINRRDGLTDIVVGIAADDGPKVLVFEGPLGALRATPEVLTIPAPAESVALAEIDGDYPFDLLVAAGNRLRLVHGRDRRLTLPNQDRATVAPARVTERVFGSDLKCVSVGDFTGDGFKDIAVLSAEGAVHFLLQPPITQNQWDEIKRNVEDYTAGRKFPIADAEKTAKNELLRILPEFRLDAWQETATGIQKWTGAQSIVATRNSSLAADTLVVLDAAENRLHVVSANDGASSERRKGAASPAAAVSWKTDSLKSDTVPASILPMRLDTDALSDLVILRKGETKSSLVFTSAASNGPIPSAPYFSFTNSAFFSMHAFFETPGKSNPYPSTISVSGISDPNSKVRVRLNRFGSTRPSVADLLLVSPAGQKVLLMSDAGGTGLTGDNNITFDDAAANFIGSAPATGTFKPTNVDDGATDNFPSPAPTPPYASMLSAFNGNNLNGTWSLFGIDDGGGGTTQQSSLQSGWTLIFGDDPASQDFVVNSTADTDDGTCNAANCTLREAINAANAKPGSDRIIVAIGSGPQTIAPQSVLPQITDAVTIDATTQPGFAGTPIIELNGANAGSASGLSFAGGNSVVRGFIVNRFSTTGIAVGKGGNNIIEGNYVGTNTAGTTDLGNGGEGISLDTANNVIGGTVAAARNVISGNQLNGVFFGTFFSDPAENNLIQGNYIGASAAGNALIRNEFNGISTNSAPGSPNNIIGGTSAGSRNIIAGSIFNRVDITYVGSSGTLVQGNYIGTDVTGTIDLDGVGGSSGNGIEISAGVGDCLIGGTTPAARNLLSGNWYGVFINTANTGSPPPTRNLVQGNFIGTNVNGTSPLANLFSGVRLIFGATSNTIGGAVVEARNIISGNNKAGVQIGEINQASTFTNVIQNNYIGTDVTGNNPLRNGDGVDPSGGIIIPANADGDRIERNRIAYNRGSGIRITNVSGNNQPGIRISIIDNEIFANTGLGIDLGGFGITLNDDGDPDTGPNNLQNFPVLTSATASAAPGQSVWERAGEVGREMPEPILAAALTISGTLNSTPSTNFTVHWYFSADAQCTTNQAATRPLASGKVPNVITNDSGNAMFSIPFDFPAGINGGIVNCTATDPQGNTSEFSACFPVGTTPGPTPTPSPTPTPTPTPSPTPAGPTIFVEQGRNDLAAVDSVTFVRGPFPLTNPKNFSIDQRTRIMFFTTNLGLPQTSQPPTNTLSVQVGGSSHAVESVGPNTTTGGSVIVFRLPDLMPGTYPLGIRLNGINSTNTPNLTIIGSSSSPASAPKSNKAKLAEYLLFPLIDLIF